MTSQQTFFEKLRAHEGGLIRLDIPEVRGLSFLSGKIGVLYSVPYSFFNPGAVAVHLLIDGKFRTVLLYEEETQFLEGPQ